MFVVGHRGMTAIKPLSLVAQYDDLVRCRNTLTAGIESGLRSHLYSDITNNGMAYLSYHILI